MADTQKAYAITGNRVSDQAEPSTMNAQANRTDVRILVELQVISHLLNTDETGVDLTQLRQDLADELT